MALEVYINHLHLEIHLHLMATVVDHPSNIGHNGPKQPLSESPLGKTPHVNG